MNKALLLYPLGDIDKYEEITYTYRAEKIKTRLPALWIAEKIGGVEEITFIITEKLKNNYFSLFENLCKFILQKEITEVFSDDYIKTFRRRESFTEDKRTFIEKLIESQNSKFKYEFLIIDEENLLSFIQELKQYIENHLDYTIHIDITHAYRFIPMFIVIVISLLKNAGKNIEIGEILYAFAGADENRIISLKDYMDALNWSNAIYSFNNFANTMPIAQILKNYHSEISEHLHILQQSLDMNLASKIKESVSQLKDKFEKMNIENEIFKHLVLDDLKNVLSEFVLDRSQSDFELSLAKWHLKNRRYLHGYTALIEAMITRACESYGFNPNDRNQREKVKCIFLSIKSENLKKYSDYQNFVSSNIKNDMKLDEIQKKISILFEELAKIRNTFAHIKITDETQASNIYKKAIEFAEKLSPLILSKKIFSSLDAAFEIIGEIPHLFSPDKLQKLSELYKKINKGG